MSRWLLSALILLTIGGAPGTTPAADEPVPVLVPDPAPVPGPTPPPQPVPTPSPIIRLPETTVPTPDPRPVSPDAKPIDSLPADVWYIIEASEPLIVLASPAGLVSISEDSGPLKIRGRFVDRPEKAETRTYHGPYLYTVEAVAPGKCELIVIPAGASSAADVIRQTLTVMGNGPNPPPVIDPPGPGPGPGPGPVDPPVDPPVIDPVKPVTGFRVLLLGDESASREELNTLNSTVITGWLNANCVTSTDGRPEWRRWDRTSVSKPGMLERETKIWQDLWSQIQPQLPAGNVLVIATDNRVSFHKIGSPDETLTLLKRIRGGK